MKEAVELACFLRDLHYMPEQVQDFYPTPATVSTCMYYTGLDPRTMQPVYVEKNPHRKAMQRALIQYRRPENYELVQEALRLAGRTDLIGFGEECLIRPRQLRGKNEGSIRNGGFRKNEGSIRNGGSGKAGDRGSAGALKKRGNTEGRQSRNGFGSQAAGRGQNTANHSSKKTIRNVHKKK